MSRLISLYVCSRGAFGVECRPRSGGVEVVRSFDLFAQIESWQDAVGQLTRALSPIAAKGADVVVAMRGFRAVRHVLTMPDAGSASLARSAAEEMRRLEPGVVNPAVAFSRLASDAAED